MVEYGENVRLHSLVMDGGGTSVLFGASHRVKASVLARLNFETGRTEVLAEHHLVTAVRDPLRYVSLDSDGGFSYHCDGNPAKTIGGGLHTLSSKGLLSVTTGGQASLLDWRVGLETNILLMNPVTRDEHLRIGSAVYDWS